MFIYTFHYGEEKALETYLVPFSFGETSLFFDRQFPHQINSGYNTFFIGYFHDLSKKR